ncbi:hypothetical protein DW821_03565 [Collinsella sp. AM33-4BH]|nr:hypothetical protein DW821_03565 [Collinsella sp. AM33-4BH]
MAGSGVVVTILPRKFILAHCIVFERLINLLYALSIDRRLARKGKERLHIEGYRQEQDESCNGQGCCAPAHGGVKPKVATDLDVFVIALVAMLVIRKDKQVIERHGGDDCDEGKEDDAHGDVACGGGVAFGNGENVIGVIDQLDATVQACVLDGSEECFAVLKIANIDAVVECIGTYHVLVGMVGDQMRFCRYGEDKSVAAE